MSDGGITVTKTTTGSLLLTDIQVMVHHQIPTYIPADKALNSVDLHRALGSGAIFQMLNTMHIKPQESPRAAALEDENRTLREALQKSTQQGNDLQRTMETLARQMEALTAVVGQIGVSQVVVQGVSPAAAQRATEVVGGDVPMFIPDSIVSPTADVQVQVQEVLSEDDSVSDAQNRLRQLRKGRAG
jgi:hypothetical protein